MLRSTKLDRHLTTLASRQEAVYPVEANFPTHPLIGLLLRLVHQHYAQDIEAALRDAGFGDLRPAHANVFPFVPPEGISVSELADLARVRKQTMAQAVEELERMGYVERRPNPRDRRSRLVFLTRRGRAVRPVTHTTAARVEEHWAELTSPEELEDLRASLLRLLTQLRAT
jgi:DNA-binding MarR family transcriptional regulator